MAIQTLNTIKNWFKTNSKPTQSQFWDTWDSFHHKSEKVSVGDVDGIDELLQDKLEREVFENHLTDPNAHAELIGEKLDNGGYNGTGKNLDDRITAIELPDRVLKFGVLTLSGLNLTITSNAFAWVVNKLQFLTPASYAKTLTAATSGMYRTDIVVGNQSGTYEVVTGFEAATGTAATEPPPPTGTIKLGFISLLGNSVVNSGSAPTIEKATIVDADRIVIDDSETSFAKKSVKFLNFKAALKSYFDTIYQSFMGIVTVAGTTYQLLLTDNGKKIMCTNTTAVTFTIPTNAVVALPIGARIKVTQQGDGVITLTTTGLTIVSSSPLYTIKGQTITLEKTAINTWTIEGNDLNGEIRLGAYPNTRNDGQIPMNRVLGTDANGNLKMFTIAATPAPFMEILIPDNTLPSTTTSFTIKGSFFIPTMTVSIVGQTINYITFISDNLIKVNVTTGAIEGSYAVTLNNGLSATYNNALLITLGTVYSPLTSNWKNTNQPITIDNDGIFTKNIGSSGNATLDYNIDITKKFRIYFNITKTPFGFTNIFGSPEIFRLTNSVSGTYYQITLDNTGTDTGQIRSVDTSGAIVAGGSVKATDVMFHWDLTNMYLYRNGALLRTFSVGQVTSNMIAKFTVQYTDITKIKYVELP